MVFASFSRLCGFRSKVIAARSDPGLSVGLLQVG